MARSKKSTARPPANGAASGDRASLLAGLLGPPVAVAPAELPFRNFAEDAGPDGKRSGRRPLRSGEIWADLTRRTGGWPRAVGGKLFVEGRGRRPCFLRNANQLFAFIDGAAAVEWAQGAALVTQERFFEYARGAAEAYDTIESLPHFPPRPGAYYFLEDLPESGEGALEALLDCFKPDTPADRDLIRAMLCTPFWGGTPGRRPAFLITGRDDDGQQGRGVGKTTLIDCVGELAGGALDVLPSEDIAAIKTRLLSPGGRQVRVGRLDNIKTHRFSSADLEGLITCKEISGRELYEGEGTRPNMLTWLLTINGAALSKDMAHRVVPIVLARPAYSAGWQAGVAALLAGRRLELLADVRDRLAGAVAELPDATRKADWEQEVLARAAADVGACRALIRGRTAAIDDDDEERDLVRAAFQAELRGRDHDPATSVVFIPSAVAADWVNRATGDRLRTNQASAKLKLMGIPELSKTKRETGPGFLWRGTGSNAGARARALSKTPWE